ncbi:uncharacterized protein ELE39_003592 [Cryptosporidium sp. chipmunk genotype I]|uniref:uncharacterized protein n=1 Tax=Cryptosporidium sp. chipmunk genotype I TaxID=1280935 RepID=UPI00351A861C|nr:hypothetical protein ELE39_003592 [Cryptosporidium sp. chipmunk genotype I]
MGIFGSKSHGSVPGPGGVNIKGLVICLLAKLLFMGGQVWWRLGEEECEIGSENFHVFSFEDDKHEVGNQYVFDNLTTNSEHELNSPFGIVPSNEHSTGINLHVDNSNKRILQKSEHETSSGLGEASDFDGSFGEGIARGGGEDEMGSVYSEEDEQVYMSMEQDADAESFFSFDNEAENYEVERGPIGNFAESGAKVAGLDAIPVDRREGEPVIIRKEETETERKMGVEAERRVGEEAKKRTEAEAKKKIEVETTKRTEAKGEAEARRNERRHNHHVARGADHPRGEAKVTSEKSQEKPKTAGTGSLGRSRRASEGESEEGGVATNIGSSEGEGKGERETVEGANFLSDRLKAEVDHKKQVKAIPISRHESKEKGQAQDTSYDSANTNATGSISSSTVPIFKVDRDSYTKKSNDTLDTEGAESSKKVLDTLEEVATIGEANVGFGRNFTTETIIPASSTIKKPNSLKKATSSSNRDRIKKKSSRTEDLALKKVSKESSKEGLESSKPGRLGSSRGDQPRPAKQGKLKQDGDLKLSSKEAKESEALFKDRYRCLNINTNIFESLSILDPLSLTCSARPDLENLKGTRLLTEEEDKEQRRGAKQNLILLKSEADKGEDFSHPIWQEFAKQTSKMCTRLVQKSDLNSKKPPAVDFPTSRKNISSNLNNSVPTSTTTITTPNNTEITTETLSGIGEKEGISSSISSASFSDSFPSSISTSSASSTRERPDTLGPVGTESKEEVSKHDSITIHSHDAKRESRRNSKSIISWAKALQKVEILSISDRYIQAAVKRMLKFNIYIHRLYRDKCKRLIIRRAQGTLGKLKIVNKSQMIKNKHFLGAYTILGSLLSAILLLVIVTFHGRQFVEKFEDNLEEAETIKKLGLVGGKIKMLSSHISNSDSGVEKVVFSDDPKSICQKILETKSKSIVTQSFAEIDYNDEKTDSKGLNTILDLTNRLEENNEILLHLSNGLAKCAQSLKI